MAKSTKLIKEFHKAFNKALELSDEIAKNHPEIDLYQEQVKILSKPLPYNETVYNKQIFH